MRARCVAAFLLAVFVGCSSHPSTSPERPAPPPGYPTDGASLMCRTEADCPAIKGESVSCTPPMTTFYCGLGPVECEPGCLKDDDCDTGYCNFNDPTCVGGGVCDGACVDDSSCSPWAACKQGACTAFPCDACADHFACTNGACGERSCSKDADCADWFCVLGACSPGLGTCDGC